MKTSERPPLGATGEFPDGKLCADDEGGLTIAVVSDPDRKLVRIEFGKPIAWIAIPPDIAIDIAERILHHALRAAVG